LTIFDERSQRYRKTSRGVEKSKSKELDGRTRSGPTDQQPYFLSCVQVSFHAVTQVQPTIFLEPSKVKVKKLTRLLYKRGNIGIRSSGVNVPNEVATHQEPFLRRGSPLLSANVFRSRKMYPSVAPRDDTSLYQHPRPGRGRLVTLFSAMKTGPSILALSQDNKVKAKDLTCRTTGRWRESPPTASAT
jgi:hypothetical protein